MVRLAPAVLLATLGIALVACVNSEPSVTAPPTPLPATYTATQGVDTPTPQETGTESMPTATEPSATETLPGPTSSPSATAAPTITGEPSAPTPTQVVWYMWTVRSGDTLWLIAQSCGVELDLIIEWQDAPFDPDLIEVGDIIYIPGVTSCDRQ